MSHPDPDELVPLHGVYLPRAMEQQIIHLSRVRSTTVGAVVRDAIRTHLEAQSTVDRATDLDRAIHGPYREEP